MIEAVIIRFLEEQTGYPAYGERPESPPDEYILVEKTGGGMENWISSAMIAVQSYSGISKLRAAEINRTVELAMRDLDEIRNISRCSLNTSYDFTDTETKEYRYQAVFDITYMEG